MKTIVWKDLTRSEEFLLVSLIKINSTVVFIRIFFSLIKNGKEDNVIPNITSDYFEGFFHNERILNIRDDTIPISNRLHIHLSLTLTMHIC